MRTHNLLLLNGSLLQTENASLKNEGISWSAGLRMMHSNLVD